MIRKILLGLLAVLIIIQFFRPERNLSGDDTGHLANVYSFPGDVAPIIERACYDCHSNKTKYPWYAHVQPAAWWLANHVNEGKEHLNFSAFTSYPREDHAHIFEEIVEVIEEKEMPLRSYTFLGLHPEARLTEGERTAIIAWAREQMAVAEGSPGPGRQPEESGEQED